MLPHAHPVLRTGHLLDHTGEFRRDVIEQLLGFPVNDLSLYREAFMHKSAMRIYRARNSFQRLEFIGDAAIGLIVTRYIYERFNEQEGFLTRLRTKLVNGSTLAGFSRMLGFERFVLMDHKGIANRWNENTRILEDVFESFVGAIYIDLGLEHCKRFLLPLIDRLNFGELLVETNFKDVLMRYCQSEGIGLPVYTMDDSPGSEDQAGFVAFAAVRGEVCGRGEGRTKKLAEQEAAREALETLRVDASQLHRK